MPPEKDTDLSRLPQSRREFINTGLQAAAVTALLTVPGISKAARLAPDGKVYSIQEVIDIILKEVGTPLAADTADTIKAGSAANTVTGIVTTMFPTVEIIREAIRLKANFIIAHEPSFYNHEDKKDLVPGNEVVQRKLQLLDENHITVWRGHDSLHTIKPDMIIQGVVDKVGWGQYYQVNEKSFSIPAATLNDIVLHLKSTMGISHVRVIGDLTKHCKKVALFPGAWGFVQHAANFLHDRPDVIIVGEASEWETPEFIRDARLLGWEVALVILGHAVSEEPGMELLADWLRPRIPGVKITHIASKDPFTWL